MSMGASQYDDEYQDEGGDAPPGNEDEEFVELDLERTLTWTGNAVTVQAGGEFRMPLIVPYPSVLAIQFEVDGGYDIEFSLTFKDDNDNESSLVSGMARPPHFVLALSNSLAAACGACPSERPRGPAGY